MGLGYENDSPHTGGEKWRVTPCYRPQTIPQGRLFADLSTLGRILPKVIRAPSTFELLPQMSRIGTMPSIQQTLFASPRLLPSTSRSVKGTAVSANPRLGSSWTGSGRGPTESSWTILLNGGRF
jgi:hypothetical protein